jgi:hypothetical protein
MLILADLRLQTECQQARADTARPFLAIEPHAAANGNHRIASWPLLITIQVVLLTAIQLASLRWSRPRKSLFPQRH